MLLLWRVMTGKTPAHHMANGQLSQDYYRQKVDWAEGLSRWFSGEESACQCRKCSRHGFHPQVRKIPWHRNWQPTPVFLPGKFHGQRCMAGYSPWDSKESDRTVWLTFTFHFFSTDATNQSHSSNLQPSWWVLCICNSQAAHPGPSTLSCTSL